MSIQRSIGLLGAVLALALSGCVMDATGAEEDLGPVGAESNELGIVNHDELADEVPVDDGKTATERRRSDSSTLDGLYLPVDEPDPEPWK